jgi:vacuolar protein sorting-associated protein 45
VQQVQEFYADYYAVNPDAFTAGIKTSLTLSRPRERYSPHDDAALRRSQQALLALFLALKTRPAIRYLATSEAASKLALELNGAMTAERSLFTFSRAGALPTLLLVLDRREDPVTPLLSQWTYQAMLHELAPKGGISDNVVSLKGVPDVPAALQELVLAPTSDEFYRQHMHDDYGRLSDATDELKRKYASTRAAADGGDRSMAALMRAVEAMPEIQRAGAAASKHIVLGQYLAQTVDSRREWMAADGPQRQRQGRRSGLGGGSGRCYGCIDSGRSSGRCFARAACFLAAPARHACC